MNTAAITGITVLQLIGYGLCLGIGFWASRHLTNVADEYLLKWNKKRMEELTNSIAEELTGVVTTIKVGASYGAKID